MVEDVRATGRPAERPGVRAVVGDLLLGDSAIAQGVNTAGVMGAGLAAQLVRRYPGLLPAYRAALARGDLRLGGVFGWIGPDRVIWNLATQPVPGPTASLDRVAGALAELAAIVRRGVPPIGRLALPLVGAGLGGLDPLAVEDVTRRVLGGLPIPVDLYVVYQAGLPATPLAGRPLEVAWGGAEPLGRQLSNLAPTPFVFDGRAYASVEGFYQGLKHPPAARAAIAALAGVAAKRAGRGVNAPTVTYRGVVYVAGSPAHLALVEAALRTKLAQHPPLATALRASGNRPITHPYASAIWSAPCFVAMLERARADLQADLPLVLPAGAVTLGPAPAIAAGARGAIAPPVCDLTTPATAGGLAALVNPDGSAGGATSAAAAAIAHLAAWIGRHPHRSIGLIVAPGQGRALAQTIAPQVPVVCWDETGSGPGALSPGPDRSQ